MKRLKAGFFHKTRQKSPPDQYATVRSRMEERNMRGVHSAVDDIRRNVFTEVARLAYEVGDQCFWSVPLCRSGSGWPWA